MGVMSDFEKFFVNRSNERTARKALDTTREYLTIPVQSSMLEIGAGRGALSYSLLRHYKPTRLAVTDYDPSQVKEAEAYFNTKLGRIPVGVEFKVADALMLPFEDESFDAVFAMHVLHHTEKHEWHFKNIPRVLNEIRRVLKPEGNFLYEETFKKNAIRANLAEIGFVEVFVKQYWKITDFCVYKKTAKRSAEAADGVLKELVAR